MLALFLAHCGSDSGSGTPATPAELGAFVGTWMCDTTVKVTFTKPAGTDPVSQMSSFELVFAKAGTSEVTATNPDDASCKTTLKVSGSSASLGTPETCDQGGLTFKQTAASIKVTGNKLSGTRTDAVSGKSADGSDVAGTGTTTIDCTKVGGTSAGTDGGTGNNGAGGSTGSTDACTMMCQSSNSDGSDTLDSLLLDCACQMCSTECASSACSATNPMDPATGDPCDVCIQKALGTTGTCVQSAIKPCQQDASCLAFANCLAKCP